MELGHDIQEVQMISHLAVSPNLGLGCGEFVCEGGAQALKSGESPRAERRSFWQLEFSCNTEV